MFKSKGWCFAPTEYFLHNSVCAGYQLLQLCFRNNVPRVPPCCGKTSRSIHVSPALAHKIVHLAGQSLHFVSRSLATAFPTITVTSMLNRRADTVYTRHRAH